MLSRAAAVLLSSLLIIITLNGCKDETTGPGPDTTAPTVVFTLPIVGDTVGVESVTVALSATDDVGVTKVEIFIDGGATPVRTLTAAPWDATLSITGLADGQHTLTAKAYDEAGNVGTAAARSFVKGIRTVDVVRRMVLAEVITSANCTPCGPANEYLHTQTSTAAYAGRLAVIKYHAPIPRSTDRLWKESQTWGRPRMTYLFAPVAFELGNAPNAWINGTLIGSVAQNWVAQIDQDLTLAPDAKIELTKVVNGSTITLTIKATGLMASAMTDLRLHTVVTESDIEYNDGNSENIHYDVMRTMLPDAAGEQITLAKGETKTFTRQITIDPTWVQNNCDVVVFIQSNTSKYVLQAAQTSLH